MSCFMQSIAGRMHTAIAMVVAGALLTSCAARVEWTDEQEAVYEAMQAWAVAVSEEDPDAMWEMLSPDARKFYQLERRGVVLEVKSHKAALDSEHLSEEDRKRSEATLARYPDDLEGMTPREFYGWQLRDDFTLERVDAQRRHFSRQNVEDIEIEGNRATVKLRRGEGTRHFWVRHDGVWKYDLSPSRLRELRSTQALEEERD